MPEGYVAGFAVVDVETTGLSCLRHDAPRLPASTVTRMLETMAPQTTAAEPPPAPDFTILFHGHGHTRHGLLILQCALAASSADLETEQRADLAAVIAETAAALRQDPDPATALQAWVLAHRAGFTHSELSRDTPEDFFAKFPLAALVENAQLLNQAKTIAATQYGVSIAK